MTINNLTLNNSSYLSEDSAKEVLPYVAASCTSYTNDESWITPLKYHLISPSEKKLSIPNLATLQAHEKCFFDPTTGLKISLVEGKKEIILSFGALESGNTEVPVEQQKKIRQLQLDAAAFNLLGANCEIYEQAAKFVEEFIKLEEFKDKKIVVVGQSLGGSLAQYAGLKNQLQTYCFNPIPLGRAQIKKLKADNKIQDDKMVVVSIEGDYAALLAENKLNKVAQWVFETPVLFGKKFTIPSAYSNLHDTHVYFMGSLMKYLGYDIRTKIDSIPIHELCVANDEKSLDLAISDLEQALQELFELKTLLNENNSDPCSKKLQLIKDHSPWIFNYLAFITWLANEGRDLGDWNYGEHRLLETPLILNKINVDNIPILDLLMEHLHVLLFIQNAKKSFSTISKKAEEISKTLTVWPTIYQEKCELERGLNACLHSNSLGQNRHVFDEEAWDLLQELNQELQNTKGPSKKQKLILDEISYKHPKLYCSMMLLLRQHMKQPALSLDIISKLIQANPSVLIRFFNNNQNILMQLIECMECIHQLHTAMNHLEGLKMLMHGHSSKASNGSSDAAFSGWDDLYQKIAELETAFRLDKDIPRLLENLKGRIQRLDVSPKEAIQPDRITERLSTPKKIYMVAAEYLGICQVGGLAEAVRGIAEGLKELGHEVVVIMPKYSVFPQDGSGEVAKSLNLTPIVLKHSFGGCEKTDRVFSSKINGVDLLFIEDSIFPGRSDQDRFSLEGNTLYKFPDDPDEVKMKGRFAYFAQAAGELVKELKEQIDLVFFHDWHGALAIPQLARNSTKQWIEGTIPPLVYVFHNNGYSAQGRLYDHQHASILRDLKLPPQTFNTTEQCMSLADHVCTVSESYALEVQGIEGRDLKELMRLAAKKRKLSGVTNGCNLSRWNPHTQPQLVNWIDPFTQEPTPIHLDQTGDILQYKGRVKQQLQHWLIQYHPEIIEKYGVDVTRDNLIVVVGRYDSSQKGIEKFRLAMQAAAEKGATFIAMGCNEDPQASQLLDELEKEAAALKNPGWGGAWIIRDFKNKSGLLNFQQGTEDGVPGIGHLVRAAANINFCPSEYEPCGLTHLEGFPYAQLTVGTKVGGYADIICEDTQSPMFNGFLFPRFPDWKSEEQNQAVLNTIRQAIDYYNSLNPEQKNGLMNNLIETSKQYSWTTSPHGLSPVEKYEKVIAAAIKASKSRGASEIIHPRLLSGNYLINA